MLGWFLFIAGAYLAGSVPFGLLLGRLKGVDLRAHGSKNIGATNAGRVLGKRWGLLCFALDVLKGALPTLAAGIWSGAIRDAALSPERETLWTAVALAAILGHVFPVWLGFRGGKGVATSLGALLALYPIVTLPVAAALAVWVICLKTTRYVGVSSVAAAAALPLLVLAVSQTPVWGERALFPVLVLTALLAALVIWRHRGNLSRTLRGEEPKVGSGARGSDTTASGR